MSKNETNWTTHEWKSQSKCESRHIKINCLLLKIKIIWLASSCLRFAWLTRGKACMIFVFFSVKSFISLEAQLHFSLHWMCRFFIFIFRFFFLLDFFKSADSGELCVFTTVPTISNGNLFQANRLMSMRCFLWVLWLFVLFGTDSYWTFK